LADRSAGLKRQKNNDIRRRGLEEEEEEEEEKGKDWSDCFFFCFF